MSEFTPCTSTMLHVSGLDIWGGCLLRDVAEAAGFKAMCRCAVAARMLWQQLPALIDELFPLKVVCCGGEHHQRDRSPMLPFGVRLHKMVSHDFMGFDDAARTWKTLPSMNQSRANSACVGVGSKLFVIGGVKSIGYHPIVLDSFDCFDADIWKWQALPSLPTGRSALAAALVHGYIYAVGGNDGHETVATAERFSLKEKSWEVVTPMPTPREALGAVEAQGCLLAIGGSSGRYDTDPQQCWSGTCKIERFLPELGVWEQLASIPGPENVRSALLSSQAVVHGGSIVILGGYDVRGDCLQWMSEVTRIYDPVCQTWQTVPHAMADARRHFGAVVHQDHLWVLGGHRDLRPCNSVETLDLRRGTEGHWEREVQLPKPMSQVAAASLRVPRALWQRVAQRLVQ